MQAELIGYRTIDPANAAPAASRVKVDAVTPQYDMLLQFAVPAGCATVTAVRLTLTVAAGATDPAVGGGDFYATDPADPNAAWSESTVAWGRALANRLAGESNGRRRCEHALRARCDVPGARRRRHVHHPGGQHER